METEWTLAIGKMTFGIYVLTTAADQVINGMIASWVSMVSFDPPLVMVAVHSNRYSHKLIERSGYFALNIISRDHKAYLSCFKGSDPVGKFAGIDWRKGQTGSPILADSIGYLECTVWDQYKPGNHTLFIGQIIDAKLQQDNVPLSTLDYEGVYLGKN